MKFHIFGFPKQNKCLKYPLQKNFNLSNIMHKLSTTLLKLISSETFCYILPVNPFSHTWLPTDVLKNLFVSCIQNQQYQKECQQFLSCRHQNNSVYKARPWSSTMKQTKPVREKSQSFIKVCWVCSMAVSRPIINIISYFNVTEYKNIWTFIPISHISKASCT